MFNYLNLAALITQYTWPLHTPAHHLYLSQNSRFKHGRNKYGVPYTVTIRLSLQFCRIAGIPLVDISQVSCLQGSLVLYIIKPEQEVSVAACSLLCLKCSTVPLRIPLICFNWGCSKMQAKHLFTCCSGATTMLSSWPTFWWAELNTWFKPALERFCASCLSIKTYGTFSERSQLDLIYSYSRGDLCHDLPCSQH